MIPSTITLTVTQGNLKGKEYLFDSPARCMIGRAGDCDVQLPSDYFHANVSRHHCVLEIAPPTIRVRDLGSRNGTFVNGVRIERPPDQRPNEQDDPPVATSIDLRDGDELQLGNTAFGVTVENARAVLVPLLFC
jgi:pSer/pThr/pTyr-binding forkhead associated (FHA) protein